MDYEKLTVDQENETRKLIKYLGLKWEMACLSPHKNKRSVRTASQQQVRQKIYKEALKHGANTSRFLMVHLIAYLLHKLPWRIGMINYPPTK